MDSKTCIYCTELSNYYCSCKAPGIVFCTKHLDTHLKSIGTHSINILKIENFVPNPRTKQTLLDKLSKLKQESLTLMIQISHELSMMILSLQQEAKETLQKVNSFISLVDSVLVDVLTINTISSKPVYSPLESLLLSYDASSILNDLKTPSIAFSKPFSFISFIPSTFPHLLYNFSDLSVYMYSPNTIKIYPSYRSIECFKLSLSARCLNIGENRILFTGGNISKDDAVDKCFVLNVSNGEVTDLPPLKKARKWHAMAWIQGHAAVIGGNDNAKNYTRSVEILEDKEWKELSSIHHARASFAACNTYNAVWILGGVQNNYVNSIEVFQQGIWSVMFLTLPKPCISVGLCSVGNDLILIGGKSQSYEPVKDAQVIDTITFKISEGKALSDPAFFGLNQFYVTADKIIGLGKTTDGEALVSVLMASFK